ncbi:MAG: hypothetical protein WC895_01590 [Candidatus Shapirobacteria bacterium]|jgi:hypothetical protein
MRIKEKVLTILLILILIVSGTIRFLQTKNFNNAFTFDQARDMLDLRVLGGFHDFQVSGPTTSITGLNLGPYYYFFNLPAFWLGQGNPQFLVYWNIIAFLLTAIIIFSFFYKKNIVLGFFIAIIFLMSPQLFSVTRYFWNANAVVYFIVFYFLALWNFLEKKDKTSALIFGITAGLVIQFEAAFGSMCVAFSILVIILSKSKINFRNYLIGLLPWFLPQLAFEIKHKFQMTKLFLGILDGSNPILGEKTPLNQVFGLHWKTIIPFFEGQFMLAYGIGLGLLIIALTIIFINKNYRKIGLYLISLIIFALIYYTTIYHHELKMWYLEGIRVWYCFVIGTAIVAVTKYKKLFYILLTIFLIRSFYLTVIDQNSYIKSNGKSNDPKNTANLIRNIDWVYEKAKGEGFKAYNYVPEVYDYSTQYLYWWYGQKQYGYMPEKVSYSLTEVPEYIRLQNKFLGKIKPSEYKIALIYETKSTYVGWLNDFKDYCIIDKKVTDWQMTLEWREKCKKR